MKRSDKFHVLHFPPVKNKTHLGKKPFIPLLVPEFKGNEWAYLKECIDTGWVSSVGGFIPRFEKAMSNLMGGGHGVAVMNGTSALHLALLAAGILPGDEVLVPAISFVATANAVAYCGAHPVFIDVDEESWNIDVRKVRSYVRENGRVKGKWVVNRRSGRIIRAILPVHLFGHPADMDPLIELAKEARLALVEDACEALGALYKGRVVGRLGDVACLSFNGNKVITCGGGGMVIAPNLHFAEQVRHLSTQARTDDDLFFHDRVGFNYRMTNLQAAVGLAQLERLTNLLKRKQKIAERYTQAFKGLPGLLCMPNASWATPSHWLFSIRLLKGANAVKGLRSFLAKKKIGSRRLWHPLYGLPMYRKETAYQIRFAKQLFSQVVSLPSSSGLATTDQDRVIDSVTSFLEGGGRT